jgi:cell division protein FtsB
VKKLWQTYKYWVIGLSAVTWMTVFDGNNFIELIKLRSEVADLEEKRDYFKSEIIIVRKTEKELFSNNRNLEKFAREKYLMKKDNEDLFIIVDPKKEE